MFPSPDNPWRAVGCTTEHGDGDSDEEMTSIQGTGGKFSVAQNRLKACYGEVRYETLVERGW